MSLSKKRKEGGGTRTIRGTSHKIVTVAEFKEFERRFKFKPRLKIVSNVSRFKPTLNLNRVLADLSGVSNSLNSISGCRTW